jgi:hypothetical protein
MSVKKVSKEFGASEETSETIADVGDEVLPTIAGAKAPTVPQTQAPKVVTAEVITSETQSLPTQIHHFATNKHSTWTPKMEQIAKQFGLNLDDAWNKAALPHLGRHPEAYHQFVYEGMRRAALEANGNATKFIELFDNYVKQPIIQNPSLLRKYGWE